MNIFKFYIKFILQIFFVIIFFSTLHAKNLDKYSSAENISDYFAGMLALNESKYNYSLKYFKYSRDSF